MNKFNKKIVTTLVIASFMLGFVGLNSAQAVVTPPELGLGAANSYGVFGKAGVTNDAGGTTHIWGNVGADTMSTITNLVSSQVGGTIIAPAANVQTDASSTYDSLMSNTQGTPQSLDLAGTHTIGPGVYNVGGSTLNGDLTLSGAGDYIFRSSSSNTTAHSGRMILTSGACASKVFWAISTSMSIGTNAHVEGTIIAQTGSITFASGATLVGRAISLTQQVTLLLNQITEPTCVVPVVIPPAPVVSHSNSTSGSSVIYGCKDPNATNYNYFSSSKPSLCTYASVVAVVTPVVIVPKLPKTGFPPQESGTWYESLLNNILNLFR